MENGEKMLLSPKDTDLSGYSEKKADQDVEMQAGQWLDLKSPKKPKQSKTQSSVKPQHIPSRSSDRFAVLLDYEKKTWHNLEEKMRLYRDQLRGKHDVTELLQEIQQLQSLHNSVLKALRWEQKGSLDISKLPKEVQNLLK